VSLACGIVGLPNVGKSTLFNALTRARVAAENYPFCTIEPNVGVVEVPDARLAQIAAVVRPERIVPATVRFVDIAGLVAGASRGEGLGNQFLAHVRETDAVVQVVRCFDDPAVVHVADRVDPVADMEVIATELALADLQAVERQLAKLEKPALAGGDREARRRVVVLRKAREALDRGVPLRAVSWSREESALLAPFFLLTMKPTLYVANVGEGGLAGDPCVAAVEARAAAEGAEAVALCAALEAQIADLAPQDRAAFLTDLGLEEPGLARLARAAYRLLGLQTFFTAGPREVRAWQLRAGASALEAAGTIHSDFARGFIRAEVTAWEEFVACGGEAGAREAGRTRLEGRDYVVRDGDVIRFRFAV